MMGEYIYGGLILWINFIVLNPSYSVFFKITLYDSSPILILLFFILYAILLYPKDKKETYEDEAPYDKTYKDDHEIKGEKSDARIPKVRMYNL